MGEEGNERTADDQLALNDSSSLVGLLTDQVDGRNDRRTPVRNKAKPTKTVKASSVGPAFALQGLRLKVPPRGICWH